VNNPVGCDFHDFCYRTCNRDPAAKVDCDEGLGRNLEAICNSLTPAQFTAPAPGGGTCGEKCEFWAHRYRQAVSSAGSSSFDGDQRQACQCCP
jgi:hypothetical protein